jgi:DoxX-like family
MNRALWILQILLALLFLFAGGVKLVIPLAQLMKGMPPQISGHFLRLVAVLEVLGAFGLILPRLLRIQQWLTPVAAVGLVGIMIGATAVTLAGATAAQALFPLIVGIILMFVAYGRWRLAP